MDNEYGFVIKSLVRMDVIPGVPTKLIFKETILSIF